MAITSTQERGSSVARNVSGSYLDDAASPAAASITLGFTPKYFAWHNVTDRISYEWFDGAAAGTTLKTVAAGTRTLDTGDVAITVNTDRTVTIGASAILQSKQYRWIAR
jgi:hypothetical protein